MKKPFRTTTLKAGVVCVLTLMSAIPAAHAQWAVVDWAAIGHLVQEVQTLQQVLANARSQLQQAQQSLQSMTGGRGMQLLLSGVVRNYLPTDWIQLGNAIQGVGNAYPALANDVQKLVAGNAVLSARSLAMLSPADQQRISAARNLAAMGQTLARGALANASTRFTDLQGLITTIGAAKDQKAILDLQARIAAEQGMLQNEQIKMQSLYQALQAEDLAAHQQQREQIVAGHGSFLARFQPAP